MIQYYQYVTHKAVAEVSKIFSVSYLLPSDLFHAGASSSLCFSSVHIVGTLVSKLLSNIGSCHFNPFSDYSHPVS